MARTSKPALLVSVFAVALYSFSAFYMSFKVSVESAKVGIVPKTGPIYGQWKYLTFLTLIVQILAYTLHVLAYFIRPLQGLRDLVYTALAFPLASIVFYTFWSVWHVLGRELIFPSVLDSVFPSWLNHNVHTVILPMNFLISFLVHHKYYKKGPVLLLTSVALYTALLYHIKAKTGHFVYGYLDYFDDTTRVFYFAATGLFAYVMYKSGEWLTYAIHGKRVSEGVRSTAHKRKHR